MIDQAIYYLLTIIIPLRATYLANYYKKPLNVWAIYWGVFSILQGIQ